MAYLLIYCNFGSEADFRTATLGRELSRKNLREGFIIAAIPVTIQPVVKADDRLGAAFADDEGFTAAPTGFREPGRKIWRDLWRLHVTDPSE